MNNENKIKQNSENVVSSKKKIIKRIIIFIIIGYTIFGLDKVKLKKDKIFTYIKN